MKSIGLDIGTTTISAILLDVKKNSIISVSAVPNISALPSQNTHEHLQGPNVILSICQELLNSYLSSYRDIVSIGLTGQMHGILYLDTDGLPVSPLYTWQDGRGNLIYKNQKTYAEYLSEKTGCPMSTGFGLTTHFYNVRNQLVPETAAVFCTIADYVAMSLANRTAPLLHPSMAASLGLFCLEETRFDHTALQKVYLNDKLLPSVLSEECYIGKYQNQIPVSAAIGDNQASYLGSVKNQHGILVNVGTGSQISAFSSTLENRNDIEYRPFIEKTYLMVGSSLCGGYSYELLRNFFAQTADLFNADIPSDLYERMNLMAEDAPHSPELLFDTRFMGTRKNPALRASISNIAPKNFTPGHMIYGCLSGIASELYEYYRLFQIQPHDCQYLIGSGNGIRKNPLLQKICSRVFHMPLCIPSYTEEAAYGAALYALYASHRHTLDELENFIHYIQH